ncbi:cytochrome P450 [Bdellovibrio bacteriovorus]|uniref:cytochrome P450 n=1 Tax=Bdellovibrio bacteriovorus TaxID=959 RepID=UPI0021D221E8|nr:cytochrome P450 [Bdellovibrio bacteriovorus]UXR65305.1 cytochrome P450 [Bdellovibrio bacteriovorus]
MTDLYHRKMSSSPESFAHFLKSQGPVFWAEAEQIWVLTDHELAQGVLKSPDFSADRSSFFMAKISGCPFAKVSNFFGVVKKMMVTSDPPHHTARRRLGNSGITDHILDRFLPQVDAVVNELINQLPRTFSFDFVEKVALPLPNIVLADLFSIPTDKRKDFYLWSNHMTQFFGGASDNLELDAFNADSGAAHLRDYFKQLMQERREQPQDDFISHLLRSQGSLDDDEVVSQAAIMLVAGTVTTTDQICNNLHTFLQNNIWRDLVQNPGLLEKAIEEATRLDPSVNFIFRIAKKDMTLNGASIKAGQLVFVANHAVNRDDNVFTKPHEFVLNRDRNPHLSYGAGIHYCLGARLGRIQMQRLFTRLLQDFPDLSLDTSQVSLRKHQSLAFSGFENLHLTTESL